MAELNQKILFYKEVLRDCIRKEKQKKIEEASGLLQENWFVLLLFSNL